MIKPKEITIDGIVYKVPLASCIKCRHEWILHGDKPTYCPKCRYSHWDKKDGLSREEIVRRIFTHLGSFDIDELAKDKKNHNIKERDRNRCVACGTEYIEAPTPFYNSKGNLEVHHIDWNIKNSMGFNQVTLCSICHNMLGRNRDKKEA